MPFVALSHLFSLKGGQIKERLANLEVKENPVSKYDYYEDNEGKAGKIITLSEKLRDAEDIERLNINAVIDDKKVTLNFGYKPSGPSSGVSCTCCATGGGHVFASKILSLDEEKDYDFFKELVELNAGGLTEKLEKVGFFAPCQSKFTEEKCKSGLDFNTHEVDHNFSYF